MSGLPPNRPVNANDTDFEGYTAQQGLIPHAFSVDELFDDVTRSL